MRVFVAFLLAASLAVVGAGPASSQAEGSPPSDGAAPQPGGSQDDGGGDAGLTANPAEPDSPEVEALVAQAEAEGPVRVIVALAGIEEPAGGDGRLDGADAAATDAVQAETVQTLDETGDAEVVYEHQTVPGLVVDAGPEALQALAEDPNVVAITEDVAEQPHLDGTVPLVGAPAAWAEGFDGSGGNVAVIDSGVLASHPSLSGHVVAEACFSSTFIASPGPGGVGTCPNGQPVQIGPGSAAPCTGGGCFHGTHVASIVSSGAAADGPSAEVGTAPGAGIVAVQVFTDPDFGNTQALISDQEVALDWLFQNRVALDLVAVNMSLGGGGFTTEAACDASNPIRAALIGNLRDAGVPVVISSGNSGSTTIIGRPGCFSTSISVGNTTNADVVNSSSQNAPFLDLLAPGTTVCAAVPSGGLGCGQGLGSQFDNLTGTSMAAPHVAGAMAILKDQHPTTPSLVLLERLQETGVPVTDTRSGANNNVTSRIQVDEALSPFGDVGFTHPFFDDIEWMADEGVSTGFPTSPPTYQPSSAVSRQAMSAFMYRLAGEPSFSPPGTATFADVGTGHPFFEEVEWMAFEQITTGFPTSPPTYQPSSAVSRQAMSAFMYRLAGEPVFSPPGTATFADVSSGHPFFAEVEWMADESITNGFPTSPPTYQPSTAVSRQAMSAFMRRLAEGPGVGI